MSEIADIGKDLLITAEVAALAGFVALKARKFRSTRSLNAANTFSAEEAACMASYAEKTVEYMHQEGVGAIALIDGAARPFAYPLMKAWHERSNDQPDAPARPPILFINPQGFEPSRKGNLLAALSAPIKSLIKGDRLESALKRRRSDDIQADLPKQLPELYAQRNQPVLIFDACLHSGKTAEPILDGLSKAGFTDVRFGVVYCKPSSRVGSRKPDVILAAKEPIGACYPFGIDKLIEKTYATAHSRVTEKPKRQLAGAVLRANLKEALAAHYSKSNGGESA